jgi:hypothetical protein
MFEVSKFLDQYVRIDEGTAVVVCAHRSYAQTAAWLYTAIFMRGIDPSTVMFVVEEDARDKLVFEIAACLARPSVRRVAVVVCEPAGPSFCDVLEMTMAINATMLAVFRISGPCSTKTLS